MNRKINDERYKNIIKLVKKLPLPVVIALTVYGEARGEPKEGKEAVAWVCLNRERNGYSWDDILSPKQFSCWNNGDPNLTAILSITPFNPDYSDCLIIAFLTYHNLIPDPTDGATHYYAPELMKMLYPKTGGKPYWAKKMTTTAVIGQQVFLKA